HRHEDHIKGFDHDWFEDIEVKNVWLSAALDPKHPQAKGVTALREFATDRMRELVSSGQALTPEVQMLASMYVSNEAADELLMKTLPSLNDVEPFYAHAGMAHKLPLPADTAIHILAPEEDIDHFYLGKDLDQSLTTLKGLSATLSGADGGDGGGAA